MSEAASSENSLVSLSITSPGLRAAHAPGLHRNNHVRPLGAMALTKAASPTQAETKAALTPVSFPILYDQRRHYSLDENKNNAIQTNTKVSPASSGEAWLRRLEGKSYSPAGVGESWLRDEEQGAEPLHADQNVVSGPSQQQRERRLSTEWREAMSARARRRFHAQPQAASVKKL